MARLLVTGAAGFVGRHVARAARAAGYLVRAVDSDGAGLRALASPGIEVATADLCRVGALPPLLDGSDGVIHCAGRFDFGADREVLRAANVLAVERVIAAALEARTAAFVHISSAGVYGLPVETPIAEGGDKRPKNAYEETMWEGERAVLRAWRERGLPARVLRPALIYGAGGRTGVVPLLSGLALTRWLGAREVLFVEDAPKMHHVHAEDVASAALLLLEREEAVGRAFNCGDDAPLSWSQVGAALCTELGLGRRRVPATMLRLLFRLPDRVRSRINDRIGRRWRELRAAGLAAESVQPRLERDLIEYLAGDHVYDVAALRALGFTARHPGILDEIPALVGWYQHAGWLPGEPARGA